MVPLDEPPNKRARTSPISNTPVVPPGETTFSQFVKKRNAESQVKDPKKLFRVPEAIEFLTPSDRDKLLSETIHFDKDFLMKGKLILEANKDYEAVRWVQLPNGEKFDLAKKRNLRVIDWRPLCEFMGLSGASKYKRDAVRIFLHRHLQSVAVVESNAIPALKTSEEDRLRQNTIIRICNGIFSTDLKHLFSSLQIWKPRQGWKPEPAPVEESENLLLESDDESSCGVSYNQDDNRSDDIPVRLTISKYDEPLAQ